MNPRIERFIRSEIRRDVESFVNDFGIKDGIQYPHPSEWGDSIYSDFISGFHSIREDEIKRIMSELRKAQDIIEKALEIAAV